MNISKQAVLDCIDHAFVYDEVSRNILRRKINALPSISDGWISVANVPLNVEVIHLDTMTSEVNKCKYIRYPDESRGKRYFWMPLPPAPTK